MSDTEVPEDPKKHLKERILYLENLRLSFTTPLLDDEIDRLTRLYRATLESLNPQVHDGLEKQLQHVESHWARINQSASSVTNLIRKFQQMCLFLSLVMHAAYSLGSDAVKQYVLSLRPRSEIKPGLSPKLRGMHELALEEMDVDKEHAWRRISPFFLVKETVAVNETDTLVDRRDWHELAALITKDRALVKRLQSGGSHHLEKFHMMELFQELPSAIDDFQNKYFDSLTSPDSYTLSSNARRLLTGEPPHLKHIESYGFKMKSTRLSQSVARGIKFLGRRASTAKISHPEGASTGPIDQINPTRSDDEAVQPSVESMDGRSSMNSTDGSITSELTVVGAVAASLRAR